ncbi:MAG TPA: carboxypeptidase regulatory-like domain-containing protein, partial [Thermoanaerobaculia bacterium]|nr:carboxypeptidase regulatory-like domain-containing protein [Thermoanaerobaculia bacterium]
MRVRLLALSLLTSFALSASAAITGTVMNRDGQPLPGAKVSVFALETAEARRARLVSRSPERQALATAQTDSKGSYSVAVPAGPAVVDLRAEVRGYAPATLRAQRDEEVGALPLSKADMKQGTVTARGKGVAGATVVWMAGASEWVAVTDSDGRYSAPDPARWAGRMVIFHPDYALLDEAGAGPAAPLQKKGLDRSLQDGVTIGGRVLAMDGKSPAAKAAIFVDEWPVAQSGDDGAFTIAHAPKSWKSVQARLGDQFGTRAAAAGPLSIRLAKAPTVSGTVRDAKSRLPLQHTEVRVSSRNFGDPRAVTYSTFTDAKGTYSLSVVPGTFDASAWRVEYATSESPVTLSPGESVQRAFNLNPLARISGTVVDE